MRFFILCILTCSLSLAHAQHFQQALSLLTENKRTEAKAALTPLINNPSESQQALLSLTLLELNNSHFDEALTYFNRYVQQSNNPYPYIYALWSTGIFSATTPKSEPLLDSFMNKIAGDEKAPLAMRAMAYDNMAQRIENGPKFKEALALYNRIGDIRNWSSVGVFENISASGFNKDFGVLTHPEPGYVFKNSTGADVGWFTIPDARNDRWLDLTFHYDVSNAIIYSQTFLQSDADKDVKMLLGVSGSVKVWINDFLVLSEEEERNTDLDVYTAAVKLQKGVNRILIQSGSSEIDKSNFLLRFADMNDHLLTNFTSTAAYSPYQKALPYKVERYPFFAEAYFQQLTAGKADDLLNALMLAYTYKHNDARFEAAGINSKLKKQFPHSTIVSELMTEAYSRDNNNTDLTRELEFIKSNDSLSLYGLMLNYSEAFNKEEYDEARRLLNKRIEIYGDNEDTEYKQLELLVKRSDIDGLIKELEKAYQRYPDNVSFANMKYNLEANVNKDKSKADTVLETFLNNHYNEQLLDILVNDKMALGKKDEAMQMLTAVVEKKPYAIKQYTRIADKYFELQDYAKAAQWEQKAIARAPFAGEFHHNLGLIQSAAGKNADAIGSLIKAIQYNPSNYAARRKLNELQGKKDLFANFKETDIQALYKAAPKADAYPNDNSIYLLRDLQEVIYAENGASEEKYQYLVKIFNQAGIDAWKEISIPYNGYTQRLIILKADILKKDGSRVQAERKDNEVVFSSLETGDAVYISYKLENAFSGKLAEHFWQEFTFNSGYPVKQASFSMIVPASRQFHYKLYNSSIQPVITSIDDNFKMYSWEIKDNPRVETEAYMPVFSDISQRIVVSSIPDWNYIRNWYNDLSTVKLKADFAIKEKVKELLAGKEHASDLEKAKSIYNYIQDNFNYSDVPFLHSALTPQRASRTLSSKLGDCKDLSVLFTSMAREAGLQANLVLVLTRDQGDNGLDLPMIGFNHCIAQLHSGGKNYLVELTNNQLPFAAMSTNLIHANGLPIVKDSISQVKLEKLDTRNRSINSVTRACTIRLNGSKADITRSNSSTGAEASRMRGSYRHQSNDDRNKQLTSSLSNEFAKNVLLQQLSFSNLDNLSDTVKMNYHFSVDNYTSEVAGMQIFSFPWVDIYGSLGFVSMEKRQFPIALWSVSSTPADKEVITFILPAGKKLIEAPKNVSYSCPALNYSLHFEVKPDRVIATREVKYLAEEVPTSEFAAFKEVLNKMVAADKKQIAFK